MPRFTEEQEKRLAEIEEKVLKLQEGIDFWRQTGIPESTLLILLKHKTGIPQYQIKELLGAVDSLYDDYFA